MTFDYKKEYKEYKGLRKESLRDSMTNIELALTNLGEADAVEIHKSNESLGMNDSKKDAIDAGGCYEKS